MTAEIGEKGSDEDLTDLAGEIEGMISFSRETSTWWNAGSVDAADGTSCVGGEQCCILRV